MKQNIETFKTDIYEIVAPAIRQGISGSKIADGLQQLGISRENALTLVAVIGAWMNYEAHPELTPEEAYKMYAGI